MDSLTVVFGLLMGFVDYNNIKYGKEKDFSILILIKSLQTRLFDQKSS